MGNETGGNGGFMGILIDNIGDNCIQSELEFNGFRGYSSVYFMESITTLMRNEVAIHNMLMGLYYRTTTDIISIMDVTSPMVG